MFELWWNGEEIDAVPTEEEAEYLRGEYQMAFGYDHTVEILKQTRNVVDTVIIDVDSDREATEAIFQAIQGVLGLVSVPTLACVVMEETDSGPA